MLKLKIISLKNILEFQKQKNEVNPEIIKICPNCQSKDIYCLDSLSFSCNKCENKNFIPKIINA